MSRKYIVEQIVENFVFPNNDKPEYGMELVQDIKNGSVSGEVVSFSATTVSSTGITFAMEYEWSLNSAEPFIRNSNQLSLCSVHMMVPEALNYKPWIVIQSQSTNVTGSTTFEGSTTFSVEPSQFGVSSFEEGTYYFEVRFIGHRAIYPVCLSYDITFGPTPTPTPTPTITPTPSGPTPTPTFTPEPTTNYKIEDCLTGDFWNVEKTYVKSLGDVIEYQVGVPGSGPKQCGTIIDENFVGVADASFYSTITRDCGDTLHCPTL